MKIIERSDYLSRLIDLKDTPDIKIITGIRRCGKSQLMKAYIKYLEDNFKDINIIFLDFTDIKYEEYKEYHALNEYIESKYVDGKSNYLFIDEVQMCPKFELVINSLHSSMKYDIYITGSNAFLLSSDLATLFTGRYIEIEMYPFSFKEFSKYFEEEKDKDVLFDRYLNEGGLPGAYVYKDQKDKMNYVNDVYNTIITRDLVSKYKLPSTVVLKHLSDYLIDNISNITSPNKVSNTLNSNNIKTNHITVKEYINYLCRAFVFYDFKRYNLVGQKYLETLDKYYLVDVSFRNSVLGKKNVDYGRVYENIVAIELLRRGYDVYVGKLYEKEIDFVVVKDDTKKYIQVCDYLYEEKTTKREATPLLSIRDAFPKVIIARTKHPTYTYEGIKVIDIVDWLLKDEEDIDY